MGLEVMNKNRNCVFNGPYAGRDLHITVYQDNEREFVVTHNVNIKPVSYFTGRETEMQELRQRIEKGRKSVLVSGMGGIGKTHICRKLFEEYLNKHAADENGPFRHIGYIEYSGDMGSSLQNCLKFKQQDAPEQNQEAAWRELEDLAAGGKLLLFVDNVDKTISADSGLQRLRSIPGAVVLTSRQVSFGDEFEPYRIGFLGMEQCKEIYEKIRFGGIKRKAEQEEVLDLEYVIESLAGKHTITVELLAHLARIKAWPVRKLREKLEEKGFCLEFHKDGKLVNIQESYEVLYDLSDLAEAEQNILEAFSVFPYIPLAAETCNEWLLADAGENEDDNILMGLYQKGWLQYDMEQESYALHPVFAQFIYEKCKPELEKHYGLMEKCRKYLEIPESGSALECQKYIPFAKKIIEKLCMGNNSSFSKKCSNCSITLIWNRFYSFWTKIFIRNALSYTPKCIFIGSFLRGIQFRKDRNNLEQVKFISAFAELLSYIAEYKKAETLYKKSLEIREKVLGEEHPDTAVSYSDLAMVYENQGKYREAEELYKKSLLINERVLGEEHPETATSYNNLAYVYEKQGEYRKAEELYKKSLRIRERRLGGKHLDTATSYNNLADVYVKQGEYKKAEGLFEKSMQIRERVLGEEHPDTAASYNNLAMVYESQGEYKRAEELYKKSLLINEKVLGEEHPDTASGYNNLAYVYESQGEYKRAEELFKKSLRISERVLGEEHPDTAMSYNNLAGVYARQGEHKKAEELIKKSLRISERMLGEEHPDTALIYNNLAYVYESQGEYKRAEELYKKSLRISERVLGEEHPETAMSYNNLATFYSRQSEYELALSYHMNAYKSCINKLGFNHSCIKTYLRNMEITYTKWNPNGDFEQWMEEQMQETGRN